MKTQKYAVNQYLIESVLSKVRAVVLGDALMGRANTATLQFAVNFVWDQNDRVPETLGTAQEPLALPDSPQPLKEAA
jgi:hypothetical protein